MQELAKVSITVQREIFKYAVGADPKVDAPMEVLQHEEILTGQAAEDYLKKGGLK